MNLGESSAETAFRSAARAFVREYAPAGIPTNTSWTSPGEGRAREFVALVRGWQRTKAEHGWAGISSPEEYGGRGGTLVEEFIFAEEEAAAVSPWVNATLGLEVGLHTLLACGTEEQKRRYVPRMLRGQDAWCQLFSEPNAGSDLASLRTSAFLDGDEWVVNGQKVWSSRAHYAQYGLMPVRTDVTVPKHKGITYLLLDMTTPGIDVRPIVQVNRAAHFNEVFLTDVRVPKASMLGQVNDGFRVILATLTGDRVGAGAVQGTGAPFSDLLDLARRKGKTLDPVIRQALAAAYVRMAIIRYLGFRVRTAASRGIDPGPESSVIKLAYSRHAIATGNLMETLCGADGMLSGEQAFDGGRWSNEFLEQIPQRIGGGTDEIQRNTIGERILGLPREPQVDKDLPFRGIPK